jgi:hypothetical protein
LQERRHVQVRTHLDPGGRVIGADIGEQEQHQQGPAARAQVQPVLVLALGGVAALHVPSGVAGVAGMREPDRERAEPVARHPSARPRKLVERLVQPRRAGGPPERLAPVSGEPDDRLRPGARVVGIETGLLPQECPALFGQRSRERLGEADEPVGNEPLDLFRRQHTSDS